MIAESALNWRRKIDVRIMTPPIERHQSGGELLGDHRVRDQYVTGSGRGPFGVHSGKPPKALRRPT